MAITIEHAIGYALMCVAKDGTFDADRFHAGIAGVLRPDIERGLYVAYAKSVLPEEINYTPFPVKNGTTRKALHFERSQDGKDVSWISYTADMHDLTSTNVAYADMYTCSNQRPCIIGEETDLKAFEAHNAHLPKSMHDSIRLHLIQDRAHDYMLRKYLIEKFHKAGKAIHPVKGYSFTECLVNAYKEAYGTDTAVRQLGGDLSQDGVLYLAGQYEKKFGEKISQAWLEKHVYQSLLNAMPKELADSGYRYMQIRNDVIGKIEAGSYSDYLVEDIDDSFFADRHFFVLHPESVPEFATLFD